MEKRDNVGVLFRNDDKKSEKYPDYTGRCTVNGVELRLAAWIKTGARGKYMSLSFSEPRGQQERAPEKTIPRAQDDFDSEIPF
jgi:uncharacterized protein (DUF736 family)